MNYVTIAKGMVGTDLQCKGESHDHSRQGQSPNYHYKSVFDIPSKGQDGQPGEVDDFQPRANIQAQFAAGKLKGPATIRAFALKFSVDDSLR